MKVRLNYRFSKLITKMMPFFPSQTMITGLRVRDWLLIKIMDFNLIDIGSAHDFNTSRFHFTIIILGLMITWEYTFDYEKV